MVRCSGASCCGEVIRATAAVVDVDADGKLEVLIGGYGTWMFCLEGATGHIKWRRYLPKHEFYGGTKRGVVSSPLVADVDLDGELEVVTGIRSRRVFCMAAATGRLKWYRELKYDPDSSASFAIVSGQPLVIIGGGEHTSGIGDNALIALRGSDGAEIWRANVYGGIDSSPTIADLDGDGCMEVVATSLADASCYVFDAATGAIRWNHRFGPTDECKHDSRNVCRPKTTDVYLTENAVCRSYTTPLVSDLDGDGRLEVTVGSNNGTLAVLDGATGSLRWSEDTGHLVRGSPVLADVDGDGRLELVVPSGSTLRLYRTAASGAAWPMFKGRPDHLGCLTVVNVREPVPVGKRLPRQRLLWPRLVWHWLIVDAVRYLMFHLKRRIFRQISRAHDDCDY